MMEEVQLKQSLNMLHPLYKTSKIDNKSNWKYPHLYNPTTLQSKDKYTRIK